MRWAMRRRTRTCSFPASADKTAKLWKIDEGKVAQDSRATSPPCWHWSSKDGKTLVTGSADATAKI